MEMELIKSELVAQDLRTDTEKAFALPLPKLVLNFDRNAVVKAVHSSDSKTTTEELANRLRKTEDVNPDAMIESYGNPETKKDNKENKVQCQRCENWFFEDDLASHMNSHSSQILEWLYLGGYRNSSNFKELTVRTQIGYILNVSIECQNSFPGEFIYKKYDLEDTPGQDISQHFEEASEYLEEARKSSKNVLVHCIQGMSRSASFVIAYLLSKQNMTLRQAYDHVFSKRSIVRPNPGFMSQLIKFEEKVYGTTTMTEEEIHSPLKNSPKIGSDY
jgi:protein-tyrosine phosphatase